LNETVVRKRYEAIGNLQPTLVSIRHLVYRLGVNNSFGSQEDIDGNIMANYRDKKWLSYLGVTVDRNKPKEALQSVEDTLDQFKYTGCYVHGTTGTALVGIAKSEGRIARSNVDLKINGARHDFAAGVYCFKGEFQRALSFAIDRCWPIFGEETQSFTAMQNPAVALFHKPRQFNRQQKNELIIVSAKNIHSTMNI
jgi:hypothetical protein